MAVIAIVINTINRQPFLIIVSEQILLLSVGFQLAEVLVGQRGCFAASGSALQVAFLYEVWLIYLLDGACVFAHGCGNVVDAHRSPTELVDDGAEDATSVKAGSCHDDS